MKPKITRLLGAATIALALSALPAGTALAEGTPVTINISSNSTLQPDGSATLTITYTCLPGFGTGTVGTINTYLEQTQGFGSSAANAICDDHNHTVTLDQSPGPFVRAEAAARVIIQNGAAEMGDVSREVTIS